MPENRPLPIHQASNTSQASIRLTADVVVVGSGAAGAVAAFELAAAGKHVVILEAGPYVPSTEFNERYLDMFTRLYADYGGQTNADGDLAILQGRCVGGSTVVNGAVCFRTPEVILREWQEKFGLTEMTMEKLTPYFERVEKRLSVHVNEPHEINANSKILDAGCKALGISSKPLARNVKDCALSGFCLAGCASDRKQSMLVTYIPWALDRGAELYADTTVEEVLVEKGRAVGVRGIMRDQETGKQVSAIEVRASRVVLAAGAIQTPILLLRNDLANSSGQVGKNFACHPSLGMLGLFDEDVYGYRGATLGSYCDEYEAPEKGGFILEGGIAGADFLAILAPGFGEQNLSFMKQFNRVSGMVSLIHDENTGHIEWDAETGKRIHYSLTPKDIATIRKCMVAASKILFAAGAKQVVMPTYVPTVFDRDTDFEAKISDLEISAHTLRMTSYHPQGTCRMGADPKASVVSPTGETHDLRDLYIADASIFPTSLMVNPQISVYAMATRIAENVLASL